MSPTIRIDMEVFEALQKRAKPFVDTPNSVLRRELGLEDAPTNLVDIDRNIESLDEQGVEPAPARPLQEASAKSSRDRGRKTGRKRTRRVGVRSAPGTLLPEERYERPILQGLIERGGEAPAREIVDAVGEMLQNEFTEMDRKRLSSGGIRWQTRVQFVRLRLVERGWLRKDSQRGIWAISDEGRKAFESNEGLA